MHYYPYFESPEIDEYRKGLRAAIRAAVDTDDAQSPVHVFLPELRSWGVPGHDGESARAARVERLTGKLSRETSRNGLLRLFPQVISLEDASASLLETLGVKLRRFGEFDLALRSLEKALSIVPDDPEVLREIGFCYRKKGPEYHRNAASYLRSALDQNPNDFDAQGMLGGLHKRSGELEEALSCYKAAYDIEPDHAYPLVALGAIHAALGHPSESNRFYSELESVCEAQIAGGKEDYWTFLCLGEAAVVRQEVDAAREKYEIAIARGAPPQDIVSAMEQLEFLAANHVAVEACTEILSSLQKRVDRA